MKRVVLTYTVDFEDDVSDEDAIECAIEIISQDRHWPSKDQIRIERDVKSDEQ